MRLDWLPEQVDTPRHSTTNWSSYTASLRKRGSLLVCLDKDTAWLAPHAGSSGRPAVFSDAAIQFCMTIKVLFKLLLRQTTGMVASLLKLANLDWAVPVFVKAVVSWFRLRLRVWLARPWVVPGSARPG